MLNADPNPRGLARFYWAEMASVNLLKTATLAATLAAALIVASAHAAAPDGGEFFEKRIRPILITHCYECHSTAEGKTKGGLNLESREGWTKGGDSGTAITPGKPDDSLLITAVRYWDKDLQMPPKTQLQPAQVNDLIEWVKMGAPDPRVAGQPVAAAAPAKSAVDVEKGRAHWAFQPVKTHAAPAVKNTAWVRNEIDAFTLSRMEAAGVSPAPAAPPRALIRRLTFDLTGLPPEPSEVERFAAECAAGNQQSAYTQLVEKLLASPRYGERWGRHWLDLARYADTCGNASDFPVPQAFQYRDYVIRAFNDDMPYDRFVREQIAGDTLPAAVSSGGSETAPLIATGYLASARHFAGGAGEQHLTIEDAIENVGRTFLGLSLSCARCHDHKFDPLSTADYYGLYGVFSSSIFPHPGSEGKNRPENLAPLIPKPEVEAARKAWQDKIAALAEEIKTHEAAKAAAAKEPESPERKARVDAAEKAINTTREQRRVLKDSPPFAQAYSVTEGSPANARIQVRGDPKRLGEEVPRRFPAILGGAPLGAAGSGRLALASAIADPRNPLTARVLVNRLWQHHFGRGLVATPNDFGLRGQPPTHPELLDFLAEKFASGGWSIKAMHRFILHSHTWQLASGTPDPADPENVLWSRAARRRLDAESIRDSLLFVCGTLDFTPSGAHPFPPVHTWGFTQHNQFFATYDTHKRAVFQMQQRLRRHPFLSLFDGSDPNSSTAARTESTTPLQSLFMMNDPFIHQRAGELATKLRAIPGDVPERISAAFLALYGRPPEPGETDAITAWLAKHPAPDRAWPGLSRALLAANEFIYVD